MNIKGIQTLSEYNLPVMSNMKIFRNLNEVSDSHMSVYGDEPRWILRGFNSEGDISDSPYDLSEERVLGGFSRKDLGDKFKEINLRFDKMGVSEINRIYLVCEFFKDDDVEFCGHALRTDNVYVDILDGVRPSRTDWTPDYRATVPIIGGRTTFSKAKIEGHKDSVARITRDLMKIPEQAYVDFTKLKDGHFFYHDFCVSK